MAAAIFIRVVSTHENPLTYLASSHPHTRGAPGGNNNTDTESGVLTAITGPSEEIHSAIGVEVFQPHTITVPTREARTHLLIQWLFIHVFIVPPSTVVFIDLCKDKSRASFPHLSDSIPY
ncbi:hypothetical protein AVEN_136561-1 [Araneus ventricosus]|uniref:Uncharacterized protein n=1 Tax=Araneus ventricosus TaxID=182803 RepID=A0A4Y2JPL6_ARAVE|nr:hypothetical protein AVEN_136561-1 [Araneus ventricosus]